MKRLLKEPLVHFLLLGAAIFAAYGMASKRSTVEPGKIVITSGADRKSRRRFCEDLAASAYG